MSTKTRKHHYVPSFYLSQWATPRGEREGAISVLDRTTSRSRHSTPGNEAHQRDFYAILPEGSPEDVNSVEDMLADLEGELSQSIKRISEADALPTDARVLPAFIALQMMRTPAAREWVNGANDTLARGLLRAHAIRPTAFRRQAKKTFSEKSDEDIEAFRRDTLRLLANPTTRIKMDQTTLIRDALRVTLDIEDALARRTWLLGIAPDDAQLVTSDDPVMLQWRGRGDPPKQWRPGAGDPNTVVSMSIGPRHVVAGITEAQPGKRRRYLSRAQVASFNSQVALRAERWIYYAGSDFIFSDGQQIHRSPHEWLLRRKEDQRIKWKRGEFVVV